MPKLYYNGSMRDILSFFNYKLFLFITFLLVITLVATFFSTQNSANLSIENFLEGNLIEHYQQLDKKLSSDFESLVRESEKVIQPGNLTHGSDISSIPENSAYNFLMIFNDLGEKISHRSPIEDEDFLNSLYQDLLQTFPKEGSLKGIFSNSKYFLLYTIFNVQLDTFKGWLLFGKFYDPQFLADQNGFKNINYAFLNYQSRIPNSSWQIIQSSEISPEKNTFWNKIGSNPQKGNTLKYNVAGKRLIFYIAPLQKQFEQVNLGVLFEKEVPNINNLLVLNLENFLWIFSSGILLAIFGTIFFTKRSLNQIIQTTEILDNFSRNGWPSIAALESIEIPELKTSIELLTSSIERTNQSSVEQTNSLQEKNYELERANFELRLLIKIAQDTNFLTEPFEILSTVSETLMEYFHSQAAYFYTRETEGNTLNFSKRRIHSTKQVLSLKDLSPLAKNFGEDFLRLAKEESEKAISLKRIQRSEYASDKDQKFYQVVNIPIELPNQTTGALCIILGAEEYFFTEKDQEILDKIASELNTVLGHSKKKNVNYLDNSTNLYNFRYFEQQVTNEILRAQRNNSILSLLIVELDDYAKYTQNTEFQNIESLVKDLATVIRTVCRTTDIIARKEGATYFLLLPETPPEGATMVAEKIRNAVDKTNFSLEGKILHLTVSLGAAIYPTQAVLPRDLIKLATTALESAKSLGGNRSSVLRLQGGTIISN